MANERYEALIAAMREARGKPQTLAERRAQLDQTAARVRSDIELTPVEAGGVPAEWIAPPGAGRTRILYLHGGGYAIGSIVSHRGLVSRIARAAEAKALLIDYRLAPEHPFPAAVDDSVAAYRFLLKEGVAPGEIAIAGDSAGGGLALATLIALRDAGDPLPACGVTLSAWADLAITGESYTTRLAVDPGSDLDRLKQMADYYLNGADPRHPLASPLYAEVAGLPPLLMQVGTDEVFQDDSIRVAERAKAAGVDVTLEVEPGMVHVFQTYASMLPEAAAAIDRIGAFVRARTAGAVTTRP
jgi:monoterpene epsilon-lactone hydrolase